MSSTSAANRSRRAVVHEKRIEARALAEKGDYLGAARLAGTAVAYCEEQMQYESDRGGLNWERDRETETLWYELLQGSATFAGERYAELADHKDLLPAHLISAAFYSQAAVAARLLSRPGISKSLELRGERQAHFFKHSLERMEGGPAKDSARVASIQMRLRMAEVNRPDHWRAALWDGLLTQKIDELGLRHQRFKNCQRVAPTMVARLHGVYERAGQRGPDATDMAPSRTVKVYEWAYGRKFAAVTLKEASAQLQELGPGATGILRISRSDSGHVAAVGNVEGLPLYFEGQTDRIQIMRDRLDYEPSDNEYELLITHDPKDILRVHERERLDEIIKALDTPIGAPQVWKTTPMPRSAREAITKLRSSPAIQDVLPAARAVAGLLDRPVAPAVVAASLGLAHNPSSPISHLLSRSSPAPPRTEEAKPAKKPVKLFEHALPEKATALLVDTQGDTALVTRDSGRLIQIDMATGKTTAAPPVLTEEFTVIRLDGSDLSAKLGCEPGPIPQQPVRSQTVSLA